MHVDSYFYIYLWNINSWLIFPSSCRATGGLVDAGSEYEKALAEEIAKLQRLYGGGDLTSFPEFKFTGKFSFCWVSQLKIISSNMH